MPAETTATYLVTIRDSSSLRAPVPDSLAAGTPGLVALLPRVARDAGCDPLPPAAVPYLDHAIQTRWANPSATIRWANPSASVLNRHSVARSVSALASELEGALTGAGAVGVTVDTEHLRELLWLLPTDPVPSPVFCSSCQESFHPRITTLYPLANTDGDMICSRCVSDDGDIIIASDSGMAYGPDDRDHLHYDDASGEWYAERGDEDEHPCYSYSTNILDIHDWPENLPSDALCFGVELEIEPGPAASQSDLSSALGGRRGNGKYILKEDGSLNSGCEVVTLPYTLAGHRTEFDWSGLLSRTVQRIGRSGAGTTRCGMHVHVNRAALSPLTIGKMLVFLNSADNARLVTGIAQRSSNGYCQRDSRKKLTDIHGGSRYDLLNVSGSRTVEFRLFRGNLRPERVLKNLEFCEALIRYCEGAGIKSSASGSRFLDWVTQRAATYPNLVAFLYERGLVQREPHATVLVDDATLAAPIMDL